MQNFSKKNKRNSAFVMLFAVVVSGIILTITLGVTDIALKELSFDTSAKSTNDAFFAADAGVECALFYELIGEGDSSAFGQPSAGLNTSCAGTDVDLNNGSSTPTTGPWTFYLYPLGSSGNACAIVNVTKTSNPDVTTIVSKGYNLGGNTYDCTSTNPNRVERELLVVIGDPTLPPVPDSYNLNVVISGLGTVDSDPGHPGISCNPSCFATYFDGTALTLTATPTPSSGYVFDHWLGDCSAEVTNQCNLTIDQNKNVTAVFTTVTHDVTITLPTHGNITSSPGSIDCGTTADPDICTDSFTENSSVVLTADPDPGYQFDGWTGPDCSGVGTCNLIMDGDKTAGATFSLLATYPQATLATSFEDADIATRIVDLPPGVEVGDLLVVLFSVDGNNTPVTWPTNGGTWTVISQTPSSPGSTTNTLVIAHKIATAVEAGASSITVTTNSDDPSAHHAFRIEKDTFYSAGPYIQISARSNGNSTAPNSNSLTASWGATRNLWFSIFSRNSAGATNSYPANYIIDQTTTQTGVSTDGQSLASPQREWESTNNQDPAAFGTPAPNDAWMAYTLVIRGL